MKEHAINVIRELRRHGFEAYFAGGCVRDMLLGLEPTDYDVTTNADSERGHAHLSRDLRGGRAVRRRAGADPETTAKRDIVPPEHPHAIEVATFRSDGIYSDGRHPDQVQYSKARKKMCSGATSPSTDC